MSSYWYRHIILASSPSLKVFIPSMRNLDHTSWHQFTISVLVYTYSSIRIVSSYPCEKSYQVECLWMIFVFSLTNATHFQSYLAQQFSLHPLSVRKWDVCHDGWWWHFHSSLLHLQINFTFLQSPCGCTMNIPSTAVLSFAMQWCHWARQHVVSLGRASFSQGTCYTGEFTVVFNVFF